MRRNSGTAGPEQICLALGLAETIGRRDGEAGRTGRSSPGKGGGKAGGFSRAKLWPGGELPGRSGASKPQGAKNERAAQREPVGNGGAGFSLCALGEGLAVSGGEVADSAKWRAPFLNHLPGAGAVATVEDRQRADNMAGQGSKLGFWPESGQGSGGG